MTRTGGSLALLLVVVASACARLPDSRSPGAIALEALPDSTSVPPSWGNLVAVTSNVAADTFRLWFQDPAGKVHSVLYDRSRRKLGSLAAVITRR